MATATLAGRSRPASNGGNGDRDQPKPEQEQDAPLVPFVRASRERVEDALDERVTTFGSSTVSRGPLSIPSLGFLRHLVLEVTAENGAAGAATVAAAADAPFNVLDNIQVTDVNGNPIYGPVGGHLAYLIEKYGSYTFNSDPRSRPSFTDVDTDGNFQFNVRLPIEVSGRDALGALANMNASQTYKLRFGVAPSSDVYDTAPDTLPEIVVKVFVESWAQPQPASPRGLPQEQRPPAHGTTQYWSTEVHPSLGSGEQTIRFSRVGGLIRTIIAVARNSSGDRAEALFPDDVRLEFDGSLIESVSTRYLRDRMCDRYDLRAAREAAHGLDDGVYVWTFAHDLDGKAGFEMRDQLLATTQASRLDLRGNFQASTDLTIATNDIQVPASASVHAE